MAVTLANRRRERRIAKSFFMGVTSFLSYAADAA
jgi:hypothetical protein